MSLVGCHPQIHNDKARKCFELTLFNKLLITEQMLKFQRSLGVALSAEQAEVLALAVEKERITLNDIRGAGWRHLHGCKIRGQPPNGTATA